MPLPDINWRLITDNLDFIRANVVQAVGDKIENESIDDIIQEVIVRLASADATKRIQENSRIVLGRRIRYYASRCISTEQERKSKTIRFFEKSLKRNGVEERALETVINQQISQELERQLQQMPHSHANVVRLRLGINPDGSSEPQSFERIGDIMGVSREMTRRYYAAALHRLRQPAHCHKLHSLLRDRDDGYFPQRKATNNQSTDHDQVSKPTLWWRIWSILWRVISRFCHLFYT